MKKNLLLVFLIAAYSYSGAQSLTATNATTTLSSTTTSSVLQATVTIHNTSASDVLVKVERTVNNLAPFHGSYFCWTACYGEGTSMSADSIQILSGDSTTAFYGDLDPHNHAGFSHVCYNFFNMYNISDAVQVCFNYDIATGIQVPGVSFSNSLSDAFPNPANSMTGINYSVSGNDARLVLYNLLGSTVKEIKLNEKQGTLILTTSDLGQGIYYYSLFVNGKMLSTKKLVIAHR